MKLSREQIEQVLQALRAGSDRDQIGEERPRLHLVGKPAPRTVSDRDVARVKQICGVIAAMPEVRSDRLTELVAAVEHGDYDPSALDVAEKMLGRLLADKLK